MKCFFLFQIYSKKAKMNNLTNILKNAKLIPFPLLGKFWDLNECFELDFTAQNIELSKLDLESTPTFEKFVFDKIYGSGKAFGIGGYAEDRVIYNRSLHFKVDEEPRTIHLGVDIWAKTGTPIFCPMSGRIHSFKNNSQFGDYGPTIILEHEVNDQKFYTLYGHLTLKSIENLIVGQTFLAGEVLCEIGNYPENGDWPPHLHFQIINEMGNYVGDYPGVCKKSERDYYLENCPNPAIFFGF